MRALSIAVLLVLTGCSTEQSRAEQAAADLLIDPDSAKFRNVVDKGDGIWCGEINGKNRMGAYSGYQPFVATVIGRDYANANIIDYDDEIVMNVYYPDYQAKCLDSSLVEAANDAQKAADEVGNAAAAAADAVGE